MEQTVFMGRGNSKAEFLGFRGRRQAAATDRDISLPEVLSLQLMRAVDVPRVSAGDARVLCVAAFASAQPLCRATVRPPAPLEISRVTNRGSPWGRQLTGQDPTEHSTSVPVIELRVACPAKTVSIELASRRIRTKVGVPNPSDP